MRSLFLATAVACVGLFGAEQALACSCVGGRIDDRLAQADAAIVGKLVDVDRVTARRVKLEYRVKRVFKGAPGLEPGESLRIRSPATGASCGLPRRRDRRYGLLLERRHKRLTANLCSVVPPKKLRRAADGKAKGRICASR
jgi:hypothetical protein